MIQTVRYMEDATEFPHGPYVACDIGGRYRLEVRSPSGKGTIIPFAEDLVYARKKLGYVYPMLLEDITPIVEHMNRRARGETK